MKNLFLFSLLIVEALYVSTNSAEGSERNAVALVMKKCSNCHYGENASADFRIEPNVKFDANKVELILSRVDPKSGKERMPPMGHPLSSVEQLLLKNWLEDGAPWSSMSFSGHWATADLPNANLSSIDEIVENYCSKRELETPSVTTKEVLIRRLSYDLRGLPPTLQELDEFLNDSRSDAYKRLVDRWIESRQFSEHWANQWFDLARYADTDGFYLDGPRSGSKIYRDWVINSIFNDQPFDQFSIDQIAGDLKHEDSWEGSVAVGFHANSPVNRDACADDVEERFNRLVDRVNTTCQVWLGLTVQCARCHDHKLEDISMKSYYELMAIFNDAEEVSVFQLPAKRQRLLTCLSDLKTRIEARENEIEEQTKIASSRKRPKSKGEIWIRNVKPLALSVLLIMLGAIFCFFRRFIIASSMFLIAILVFFLTDKIKPEDNQVTSVDQSVKLAKYNDVKLQKLSIKARQLESDLKGLVKVDSFRQSERQSYLHVRGHFSNLGPIVKPRIPNWTRPTDPRNLLLDERHNRLDLANWVASPCNTIVPRVFVLRVLVKLFGHSFGLQPENLGPSGKESEWKTLIDQLASNFVNFNYSRKSLIRQIVNSKAYKSCLSTALGEFSLQRRRRLQAEELLDTYSMLYEFPDAYDSDFSRKRMVYQSRKRNNLSEFGQAFDLPSRQQCCLKRVESQSVTQTLAILNGQEVRKSAKEIAKRICENCKSEVPAISRLYRICLGRLPVGKELSYIIDFLEDLDGEPKVDRYAAIARVLLATDEAIYRP